MDNDMKKMKRITDLRLMAAIVFTGFLGCIYAPYELFVVNHNEFWFNLGLFWWIPLLLFLIMTIPSYIIGIILPESVRYFYRTFIFALGLCVYFQGNFLNVDVGIMNGRKLDWSMYKEAFRNDLIIWILLFVIVFVFSVLLKDRFDKVSAYISLFMTATLLLSFFILLFTHKDALTAGSKGKYLTDRDEYSISSADGNIVVFLMDTLDDAYIKEMLNSECYEMKALDGFTYFDNNTGSYTTTACSVASLLTGRIYRNESDLYDWVDSFTDEELYLDKLMDAGYDLYMYSGMKPSLPDKYVDLSKNVETGKLIINNKLHFTYDLYQLVMIKYFPDIIKPYIWMDGSEFLAWRSTESGSNVYSYDDYVFYTGLCNNSITKSEGTNKEFRYIYLWGVHPPIEIDENIERMDTVTYSQEASYQCARGCMRIVLKYIEYLKAVDAYDNTSIVIMADHGNNNDGRLLHNPAFLVKPAHSQGDLVINRAPVCQADFAATILDLAEIDYSGYGESVFDISENDTRQRYYYQYYETVEDQYIPGPYRLIEYRIDPDNNTQKSFHLTDVEYNYCGEKIKHSDYCRICNGSIESTESLNAVLEEKMHEKTDDYPVGDAKLRYLSQ